MIRIRVIDWTDCEYAICDDQIWEEIRPYVAAGHTVVFDFIGIRTICAPFIRQCITKCMDILSPDEFCQNVRFERLSPDLVHILERVIGQHMDLMDSLMYFKYQLVVEPRYE